MLSLPPLVAANLVLLAAVLTLFPCVLVWRAIQRAGALYHGSRRKLYEDAVTEALDCSGPSALAAALQLRLPGDAAAIEEALLAVIRGSRGPRFERLREAALRLGLFERNLRALRSPDRRERVRAMGALGDVRAKQAVTQILSTFESEDLNVKLVALKTLMDIGDPAAVSYFIAAAYLIPRVMVVPLAGMLPRLGPPGRRGVQTLVARFPASFPPRVLIELLRQAASEEGGAS